MWNEGLTGPLPPLEGLTELLYLHLANNLFHGDIPESYGSFSKLKDFNIAALPDVTGPIPHSLADLEFLAIFVSYDSPLIVCPPRLLHT